MLKIFSFLLISLSSISLTFCQPDESAYEISLEMMEKIKTINTLYFEMKKTERIEGDFITETFNTKLQYEPFLVYSRKIEEDKTPELLFRLGENDNKALVNPDGFPWFNISLDPMGEFMRKNQHHTLYETGYRYAIGILEHLFDKYGIEVKAMSKRLPDTIVRNTPCYLLEFNNNNFKHINYTVQNGENILDISKRNMLGEYMILELNDDVDDYLDVKDGQEIVIPNDYCPRLLIAIDKKELIPLSMKVFDDKGLYENLEYSNVKINPSFQASEFTEDQEGYGF